MISAIGDPAIARTELMDWQDEMREAGLYRPLLFGTCRYEKGDHDG